MLLLSFPTDEGNGYCKKDCVPGKRGGSGVFAEQAARIGAGPQGDFRQYGHDAFEGLFKHLQPSKPNQEP